MLISTEVIFSVIGITLIRMIMFPTPVDVLSFGVACISGFIVNVAWTFQRSVTLEGARLRYRVRYRLLRE